MSARRQTRNANLIDEHIRDGMAKTHNAAVVTYKSVEKYHD